MRVTGYNTIGKFQGTYLSNFFETPVTYKGLTYRNAEAAFQAQKCANPTQAHLFTRLLGAEAKALGKRLPLRADWNEVKVKIMYEIVNAKFAQNREIAQQLVDTGELVLVEGNTWGDTFWGKCNGEGQNKLGIILMSVREELR